MSIRDRGILKWQAALILPEHKPFQKQMNEDTIFDKKNQFLMIIKKKNMKIKFITRWNTTCR
ncbi:hypothetical protein ABEY41_01865 [Peribacillus butanolivorans]|uniref:hypothetical protein n=1 Tax=Peribacillus butanolivorans TaxID=421767 RepID=UPI003D2A200C